MTECPVCLATSDSLPTCPECDWQLDGGYLLGGPSPERQQRFDERLAAARLAHDLRAAALTAGYPHDGDPDMLERLIAVVCPGTKNRPAPDEVRRTVAHLREPQRSRRELEDFLVTRLNLLPDGEPAGEPGLRRAPRSLLLVELGADGLSVAAFTADRHGIVRPHDEVHTTTWQAVVPSLPTDPLPAGVCLAAARASTAVGRRALERDLDALADGWTPIPPTLDGAGAEIVVLVRRPLWWAVRRLADGLSDRGRRTGRAWRVNVIDDVPDSLPALGAGYADELLALVPSPVGCGLVIATVDGGGAVSLQVRPVLPSGRCAAGAEPVELRIRATMTAGQPVLLTLVPTQGGRARVDDPLSVHATTLRLAADYRLTVTPVRPGVVHYDLRSVNDDAPSTAVATVDVSRFRAARAVLPARVRQVLQPLDVTFAVEAAGPPDLVRRRFALIQDVVSAIEQGHASPGAVRYGLLPYEDHDDARRTWKQVVQGLQPTPAVRFLRFLAGVAPAPAQNVHTAPLEDALFAALQIRWRDPCRRVLVLVGSRMPNQAGHDQHVPRCPADLRWEKLLKELRARGVQVHTVWDPPSWTGPGSDDRHAERAVKIWRQLGDHPRHRLHRIDPRRFAHALGALVPESHDAVLFPVVVRAAS